MARISLGDFDQARVVPRPERMGVQMGDGGMGRALDQMAGALGQVANDIARAGQRQQQEEELLARAKAQNAALDDEIQQRAIVDDIRARVADRSLSYDQAQEELQTRLSTREAPVIDGLDPVGQENFQRALSRNRFTSTEAIDAVVTTARRADLKGQLLATRDNLGKFASDPNADVDKLVRAGAELRTLAEAGGDVATFDKEQQDFADRVYKDNASARLVAGRDDMEALNALERDLTQEGGRYFQKLDASATNTLLSQVQVRKAQIEAKAETNARKGEAAADRVLSAFEKQVSSTIPAPAETMLEWTETMKLGTPEQQAQFRELLQGEIEVRQLLSRPPAEQRAALVDMQAKQRVEGATIQQQANAKRLEAAVTQNLKDLREQPLVAYQRQTGESVAPLDVAALANGNVAAVQGQIAARLDTLKAMRKQYGTEVGDAILLPQEAAVLASALDKAPPAQAAQLFGTLSAVFPDGATYRAAMQQIAPDSPVRAYAGMVFAEQRSTTLKAGGIFRGAVKAQAGDVARTMLEGEALLNKSKGDAAGDGKGGKFPMPTPQAMTTELEAMVGSSFAGRPGAYEVAQQAVRAYYAGSAAKAGDVSGELDRKRLQEAVRAVLGEPVDINGADVLPPWGMDEDTFVDAVEARWPMVAAAVPPGLSRDFDDYQLRTAGSGRYFLVGATGAFLTDTSGNPIQIDVTAPVRPPQVKAAPPEARGSWRGGAMGL